MFISDDYFDNIDEILDDSIKEAENAYENMINNYCKQRQIVKYTTILDKDFLIAAEIIMIYLKINFILIIFFKNT